MSQTPTVIDLFCGAGGMSLGFRRAGFRVIAAFDKWHAAVQTYSANFDDHVHEGEIHEGLELPDADLIIGGPPCQGFSSAGARRDGDHRNSLISIFSKLVAAAKPRAFVFENVEGFLTGARGRYIFDLLSPLVNAGYRIHLRKVNAANFGVPQHRKRVIAIGGLGWDPSFPAVTHSAYGAPGAGLAGRSLPPTPSVSKTLNGLPDATSDADWNSGFDHTYVPLSNCDLVRAKFLKAGQRMRDLPEDLWHPSYRRRANRRVLDGTPTERRGGAPAGLRRLNGDEPSKAITGGALNEFLHPTDNRPLTIRECARLQTFPDDFRFVGSRRDAIQLIGNGVPPLLAQRFAEVLAIDLECASEQEHGELLSFIPTLANGASPVLKEVTRKVIETFGSEDATGQMSMKWA